jgi:formiminotetrahydrofolate cyclodeaminase
MNKIKSQKIDEFLKTLGSSSPTPGGGTAAALSGALSSSLVEMVANITLGKKKYEKVQAQVKKISKEAAGLTKKFLLLADNDTKAFDQVMAAYRSQDKAQVKKALLLAIKIPSETSLLSKKVESLAARVARIGNKNAYSDARSAIHLAQASYKSAQENIKINRKALAALG